MLFSSTVRMPDGVRVQIGPATEPLARGAGGTWSSRAAVVEVAERGGALVVSVASSSDDLCRVVLSWRVDVPPGTRVLNDHWERGYGDLEWRGVVHERCLPWYFLASDARRTCGVGVKTGCAALCSWALSSTVLELTCDVRNGARGVALGSRRLEMATIVAMLGTDGRSAFDVARAFCRALCASPRVPRQNVYGFNDWYYAYGQSTRETILRDAATLADLAPGGANRPYCVIDAGWQLCGGGCGGGPNDRGNAFFGDMHDLADQMRARGVRPGIWVRVLRSSERLPDSWVRGRDRDGSLLDPSVPEVLARVGDDVRRLTREWGFELVKHDYTTFDIFGLWGFEMGATVTGPRTMEFTDRSRTSAEIVVALYRAIREAAGDAYVLGCNTVGHLAAGLVDLQRTGDDTSGQDWERTRKMGVNTLAFRMPQHGAFFAADADCVGLTTRVPWALNRQWLDVLARSGTALFVSAAPEALGAAEVEALRRAFASAAAAQDVSEPLDWFDTTSPRRWRAGGEVVTYDWSARQW